jgi:hypothetical protein
LILGHYPTDQNTHLLQPAAKKFCCRLFRAEKQLPRYNRQWRRRFPHLPLCRRIESGIIYIMKKFFQLKQLHPDFFMDNCTMLINPA